MPTSTLHLNNPVPSNGAVVSSLGGRHTVTVTLAGVGAISCVVQAWGSEQGTDSRKIGAPVTVSGTTTVSQTLTFDADCKQFWLELVKLSPACKFNATVENDGTIAMPGPVRAPNVRAFDWLRRSRARMWSDPIGYAVWGSSSGEFGSTKNVLAGTNVAFAETPAGFMTAFQQRGADWDLVWNGAVDGSGSDAILAKIKSDWPTVAGKFDVAILASGFNDLTDPGYGPAYTRGNIAESIQWLIRGGVNVVIVTPFARNPSPTPLSWYEEHLAWCHAYAQANSAYPGQIMVADLQENLLVNGVTDAATYLNGNVHLNPIGAAVAVEGPSWDALAAAYGGINQFADPLAYGGTLIHQIDPATATATNATVAADDPAPDGRPQWLITATANLGKIASGALTLDTTKQHRIFLDADIVAAPISVNNNAYMDGVKLNSSNNIRFGIHPIPGGGLASYVRRDVGRRLRGFSRRFIPASTGVTMEYWPGGAGWQMRLRSAALIQVEP